MPSHHFNLLTLRNPSVMLLLGLLFALAIAQPGAAASSDLVTAMRRDTVHLPCHCPKSITILVVYWQKLPHDDTSRKFEEVKLKTLEGQEVTAHLDPRFASRAELDPQNMDLILRTVGVEDAGKYECIVSNRPDTFLMKQHGFSIQLAVTANFSVPEITRVPAGTMKNGTTVKFTCSSNEGYPEPVRLDWIISNINGTIKGEMQTHQDNDTKLYSLTSTLTWLFTETINISCVIQQKADPQQVYSDIISVEMEKEVDEPRNRSFLMGVFAFCGVIVIVVATAIFLKWRKKRKKDCPDGGIGQEVGGTGPAASREDGIGLMASCEQGGHADVHQEDLVDQTSTQPDAE